MSDLITALGDKIKIATSFEIDVNKSLSEGQVEVIVSTPSLDRQGQSIVQNGIDISRIAVNGPVMWSHDYEQAPIGKIVKVWRSAGVLKARVEFALGLNPMADMVYRMVKDGFIKAVSIGGIVKEFGKNLDGTTNYDVISKMEMIELSFCAIGANAEALVSLKSVEQQMFKTDSDHIYDTITKSVEALTNQVSALESAIAASRVPEKETAKHVLVRNRLVLAKTAAKQIDKSSEMVISSLNNLLEKDSQCQTKSQKVEK